MILFSVYEKHVFWSLTAEDGFKLDKPESYRIKKKDELVDCYFSYPSVFTSLFIIKITKIITIIIITLVIMRVWFK